MEDAKALLERHSAGLRALEGRGRDLSKPLYSSTEKTCASSAQPFILLWSKARMDLHVEYVKKKVSCVLD